MGTRNAVLAIITSVLLVLSLAILDLRIAMISLMVGILLANYPLMRTQTEERHEPLIRALLTYQLMGIYLLCAAILAVQSVPETAAVLLLLSLIFHLTLSFSTRSFFATVSLTSPLSRLLFYFSNVVYSIFVVTRAVPKWDTQGLVLYLALPQTIALGYLLTRALLAPSSERVVHFTHASISLPILSLLFESQIITLALCSIACVLTLFLLQLHTLGPALENRTPFASRSFIFGETLLLRGSLFSHRLFGPVLVEWLGIRVLSASSVVLRLITRLISYASLQRHFATVLLIIAALLIYVLRL